MSQNVDPEESASKDPFALGDELQREADERPMYALLARLNDAAYACAALQHHPGGPAAAWREYLTDAIAAPLTSAAPSQESIEEVTSIVHVLLDFATGVLHGTALHQHASFPPVPVEILRRFALDVEKSRPRIGSPGRPYIVKKEGSEHRRASDLLAILEIVRKTNEDWSDEHQAKVIPPNCEQSLWDADRESRSSKPMTRIEVARWLAWMLTDLHRATTQAHVLEAAERIYARMPQADHGRSVDRTGTGRWLPFLAGPKPTLVAAYKALGYPETRARNLFHATEEKSRVPGQRNRKRNRVDTHQ